MEERQEYLEAPLAGRRVDCEGPARVDNAGEAEHERQPEGDHPPLAPRTVRCATLGRRLQEDVSAVVNLNRLRIFAHKIQVISRVFHW